MNNQQIFHIAGEIIVISGVTIFLTNKIKKLENELKNVTQQLQIRQQTYEDHLEHITEILNAIIKEKQMDKENDKKEIKFSDQNINQINSQNISQNNNENNLSFFNNVLDSVENIVTQTKDVINHIPSSVSISLQLSEDQNILKLNANTDKDIQNEKVTIQEIEDDNLDDEIQTLLNNTKQKETIIVPNNVEIPLLPLEKVDIVEDDLYDTDLEKPVEFVQKPDKQKKKVTKNKK